MNPTFQITPQRAMIDTPLTIALQGLPPQQQVTIFSRIVDGAGIEWGAEARFQADESGTIDLNYQAPVSGSYDDADSMGLIWSMKPVDEAHQDTFLTYPQDLSPLVVRFTAQVDGTVIAAVEAERLFLAEGVERIVVGENGLYGVLFLPPGNGPHPAITQVSGSVGGLSEHSAALYASHGYAALALADFSYEELPEKLFEIPLEYFETAIEYLQSRDDIDGKRLGITGASRGGELSLLLGATFPQFRVVIADVPSGIAWSGTGGVGASWTYGGTTIPYMAGSYPEAWDYQDEYRQRGEAVPLTPGYTNEMEQDAERVKKATIPVEKTNGAVLMTSGEDDQMWPSALLAERVMDRLRTYDFPHPFEHVSYPGAGHGTHPFSMPPYHPTTTISVKHPVTGSFLAIGGEAKANYIASVDSWQRKLAFLEQHL